MKSEELFQQETEQQIIKPPKKRRRSIGRYFFYCAIIILLLILSLFLFQIRSGQSIWENLTIFTESLITETIPPILGAETSLKGEDNDRINILLMGIGGKGHDGANLTDTIILASYKPSTKQVSMISIPRDLIVPIPGYGWRKSNSIYALSEYQESGSGGKTTMNLLGEVLDIPIHYYTVVDFKGFEELVDILGGIEVDVPNILSDYEYPIFGKEEAPLDQRYEHLYIQTGIQTFDGSTALKYARSRHAIGAEGSDFARAARQQRIIEAVKTKALSVSTLTSPTKIKKIISSIDDHIDTNLTLSEIVAFAKIAKSLDTQNQPIINKVFDDGIDGVLVANNYNGAFVLEPKVEGFKELQFITNTIFDEQADFELAQKQAEKEKQEIKNSLSVLENAIVEIQNGTYIQGLAAKHKATLQDLNIGISSISNAETQDYTQTIVYQFSNKSLKRTKAYLESEYAEITEEIPQGLTSDADFLIILGLDKGL